MAIKVGSGFGSSGDRQRDVPPHSAWSVAVADHSAIRYPRRQFRALNGRTRTGAGDRLTERASPTWGSAEHGGSPPISWIRQIQGNS